MNNANEVIRDSMKECGVKQWELADKMGCTPSWLTVKLRKELPVDKKVELLSLIYEISEEKSANGMEISEKKSAKRTRTFKRDNLIIYTNYLDRFQSLSNEQFGILTRIMLLYQRDNTIPDIEDQTLSHLFDVVKFDIDRNNEKYQKRVEANRENGKKGGRKSQNPTEEKELNRSEKNQEEV